MNKILKNIIYTLMAISMFFSITSTVTANNDFSLPSNYAYLSNNAKKEVLVRLIVQIQERIQDIIAQKQNIQALPVGYDSKLSLATKVMLKSIELSNLNITEKGIGSFNLNFNATDGKEKYDVKLDFKEINYRISSNKEDKIFDFHFDSKYSLDTDFTIKEKEDEYYRSGSNDVAYKKYNIKVTNDFISLDVILLKNNFKFKINGFEKTIKFVKEDFIKEIKSDKKLSDSDKKEYISDTEESVDIYNSLVKNKWVGLNNNAVLSIGELKISSEDINKTKEAYLKNQFILFSKNCEKISIENSDCGYIVKIDFKKFSKFFKEYNSEIYNTTSKKYEIINNLIRDFDNNTEYEYYVSLDKENRIVGENTKMKIHFNDVDLRKSGDNIPNNVKIKFDLGIFVKNGTNYTVTFRDVKKEVDLETVMASVFAIVM